MRGGRRIAKTPGQGSAARGLARAAAKLRRQTGSAGNAAMAELLEGTRIHSDVQSAQEADSLGASAFTRGGEIFLGSTAPPLDSIGGIELLRHELGHVVQQTKAHGRTGAPINEPGDAFEVAADHGGGQPAGAPPAIQRQYADSKLAHFPQKFAALKKFFEDLKARGRGNLNVGLDANAKLQLRRLAQAPDPEFKGKGTDPKAADRISALDLLLNGPHPADPAELATLVAKILPSSMDPAVLKQLRPLDVQGKKSFPERLLESVERTTPNKDTKLQGPTNADKSAETARQQSIGEQQFPMAPVGQVPDIVTDMKRPDPPKAAPRKAEDPKPDQKAGMPAVQPDQPATAPQTPPQPDVITGAGAIVPTAEPQHGGLGAMPSYIDSAIQRAQERGTASADLVLGESMQAQQDVVFGQVQHLLQVHARDRAGRVTAVNVYIGGKLARTVRLGAR